MQEHGLLTGAVILTIIFDIEDTGATEFLMNSSPGRRMVRERQAFSPKEYTRKVPRKQEANPGVYQEDGEGEGHANKHCLDS